MKQSTLLEILVFVLGFSIGFYLKLFFDTSINFMLQILNKEIDETKIIYSDKSQVFYEHALADFLFNEVKIFCWVFTHPDNHKTKVPHVRQTWGRRCNKLLFMSVELDPDQPDIIALPVENGRKHLWNKTRLAMKYVYENHFNDADWFIRADDDNYIVIENLRHKLYQYHPQTAIHMGCRLAADKVMSFVFAFGRGVRSDEDFIAGGGQIFSKKALEKFIEKGKFSYLNQKDDDEFDDVLVGSFLGKNAIIIDARDEKNEKQMFPIGVKEHLEFKERNMTSWYNKYLWRNVTQGGLGCCSDTFIESHYIKPEEMYLLEFLIYQMHPFGIEKNLTEKLPRKLSLDEIMKEADAPSYAPNFKPHENVHNIDDDEKYRK